MRLTNHIAYRFLTDDKLALELIETMEHIKARNAIDLMEKLRVIQQTPSDTNMALSARVLELWDLINKYDQKAYLVTDSVHDKIDMIKLKRDADNHYDWTVFKDLPQIKSTFILQPSEGWDGGGVLRIVMRNNMIEFCHAGFKFKDKKTGDGQLLWTLFYIDRYTNRHAEHTESQQVKDIYEFIYRLLCFIYLSENIEEIIEPGRSNGKSKKQGKVLNELPVPIITITSKWNVTSIRTEGFDVSPHFRLQPYKTGVKLILIEAFRKHGYVRGAKNKQL